MKWEVTGADRQTGGEKRILVEAATEDSARRRAARQNVMVADVRPLDPNDSMIAPSVVDYASPKPAADSSARRSPDDSDVEVYRTTLHPLAVFIVPAILCLLVVGIFMLPFAYLQYRFTTFVVTNKRITIRRGWLSRRSFEMLLSKVESIHVNTTLLGRMIGCGTVVIHGTGGSNEVFPGIRNAEDFRQHATEAIERYGRR